MLGPWPYPTSGLPDVLRIGGVLEGEQADVANTVLLVEVEGSIASGEQVSVLVVPAESGDLQVLPSFKHKCPQGQENT